MEQEKEPGTIQQAMNKLYQFTQENPVPDMLHCRHAHFEVVYPELKRAPRKGAYRQSYKPHHA